MAEILPENKHTKKFLNILLKINTLRQKTVPDRVWLLGTHGLPLSGDPWCFVIIEKHNNNDKEITKLMNKQELLCFLSGSLLALDASTIHVRHKI